VLNAALDLLRGCVHLGAARLIYAGLVIVAISMGLPLGLSLLGVSLPVEQAGRSVPLWSDIIAAGVAIACFSVFFSTPLQILTWPVAVGMLAHALRWMALTVLGSSVATRASFAPLAHAVCRHWLRLRGVDDARCVPVQDGQRPCAACQRPTEDAGLDEDDNRRRVDRNPYYFGDELRPHRSEDGHRLAMPEIDGVIS
jgi:hypothetical protein